MHGNKVLLTNEKLLNYRILKLHVINSKIYFCLTRDDPSAGEGNVEIEAVLNTNKLRDGGVLRIFELLFI